MYLVANVFYSVSTVLRRESGGVSIVVSFFFLTFVSIPSLVQVSVGEFPFGLVHYSQEQLRMGYRLMIVGQLAYILGIDLGARLAQSGGHHRGWHHYDDGASWEGVGRLRWAQASVLLCIPIFFYVGPGVLFTVRDERSDVVGASDVSSQLGIVGQSHYIGQSLSLVALILCLCWLRSSSGSALYRRQWRWTLAGAVIMVLALNYPLGLPRFQLLGILIAVIAVFVPLFDRRVKLLVVLGGMLFVIFVFGSLKSLGTGAWSWSPISVEEYLTRVDFDAFKQTVDTAIFIQSNPYRYGVNFLGVLFFFVPREIWPQKPLPSGVVVSDALGYPYTNVSSPLPAEGYVSLGWVGLIITMAGFGIIIGWIEWRIVRGLTSPEGFAGYCLLAGYATIIMRGSLNAVAPMFMTAFVVLGLVRLTCHGPSVFHRGERLHSSQMRSFYTEARNLRRRKAEAGSASSAGRRPRRATRPSSIG